MSEDRIESAVQRIETALARIAKVADNPPAKAPEVPASVSSLVVKHEELRETVSNTLKELDELIGGLEQ